MSFHEAVMEACVEESILSPADCFVLKHVYRPRDDNVRHLYMLKTVLFLCVVFAVLPAASSSSSLLFITLLTVTAIGFYEICRFYAKIDGVERKVLSGDLKEIPGGGVGARKTVDQLHR